MKSIKIDINLIAIIILILFFINSVNLHSCSPRIEIFNNFENQIEKKPKLASLWDLMGSPIYIDESNPDYKWSKVEAENSWCSGEGTEENPYIIENVLINGQGLGSCIEIKNSDVCFIIKNSTIYNSGKDLDRDAGIKLDAVTNGELLNNNILFNGNGLLIQRACSDNIISGNSVNNNSGPGIQLVGGSGRNKISGNNISYNSDGISFNGSSNNFISENIVYNNLGNGLTSHESYSVDILRNRVYNNAYGGISLSGNYFDIIENDVRYNERYGIKLYMCFLSTISSNNITNNNDIGVYLEGRGKNEISENNVSYNNIGVYLSASPENTISRNNVSNNKNIGIWLRNSNITDIVDNSVSYNNNGVYILTSSENNIHRNNVSKNENIGVWLENSDINDIIENRVNSNKIGINLGGRRNTIKSNTISDNVIGILISNAK